MKSIVKPLLLVATLSAAQFAHAQQAEAPATEGAVAPEVTEFTDWSTQCAPGTDTGERNCVLFQHLDVESGQRLLTMQVNTVDVTGNSDNSHAIIVTVPLGVHLPSGLTIQVDDANPADMVFERCDQGGCYAGTILTDALLTALMRGSNCRISFNNLNGKVITATLSLNGFTAGYRSYNPG